MAQDILFKTTKRRSRSAAKPRHFQLSGITIFNLALLIFLAVLLLPQSWFSQSTASPFAEIATSDVEMVQFGFCHAGGGYNCVVDGDTIYYEGQKIRIADIDAPETHPSRCGEEARLGNAATQRLQILLNAGPFALETIDRDEDVYGRKLRIITRGGESLGVALVSEGLARYYEGGRQPWC